MNLCGTGSLEGDDRRPPLGFAEILTREAWRAAHLDLMGQETAARDAGYSGFADDASTPELHTFTQRIFLISEMVQ